MAFDALYIANRMLLAVGASTINAFPGSATKAHRLTRAIYEGIVFEVFSLNIDWHFATTRAELAELNTTPAFGWQHQYQYPAHCLKIIETVDENSDAINYPYKREVVLTTALDRTIETDVMLCDQEQVFVRYKFLRLDPATWPGWFQTLVILRGATQLVTPVKKDDFTALNIAKQYKEAWLDAKSANSAEDMETGDSDRDVDLGSSDIIDAVQDSERTSPWDTSSENRS